MSAPDEDAKTRDGQGKWVVWYKYQKFPWWPGVVVDPNKKEQQTVPLLPEVLAKKPKKKEAYLVLSLGDYYYAWCTPDQVADFKTAYAKHSSKCRKTRPGKIAVQDALEESGQTSDHPDWDEAIHRENMSEAAAAETEEKEEPKTKKGKALSKETKKKEKGGKQKEKAKEKGGDWREVRSAPSSPSPSRQQPQSKSKSSSGSSESSSSGSEDSSSSSSDSDSSSSSSSSGESSDEEEVSERVDKKRKHEKDDEGSSKKAKRKTVKERQSQSQKGKRNVENDHEAETSSSSSSAAAAAAAAVGASRPKRGAAQAQEGEDENAAGLPSEFLGFSAGEAMAAVCAEDEAELKRQKKLKREQKAAEEAEQRRALTAEYLHRLLLEKRKEDAKGGRLRVSKVSAVLVRQTNRLKQWKNMVDAESQKIRKWSISERRQASLQAALRSLKSHVTQRLAAETVAYLRIAGLSELEAPDPSDLKDIQRRGKPEEFEKKATAAVYMILESPPEFVKTEERPKELEEILKKESCYLPLFSVEPLRMQNSWALHQILEKGRQLPRPGTPEFPLEAVAGQVSRGGAGGKKERERERERAAAEAEKEREREKEKARAGERKSSSASLSAGANGRGAGGTEKGTQKMGASSHAATAPPPIPPDNGAEDPPASDQAGAPPWRAPLPPPGFGNAGRGPSPVEKDLRGGIPVNRSALVSRSPAAKGPGSMPGSADLSGAGTGPGPGISAAGGVSSSQQQAEQESRPWSRGRSLYETLAPSPSAAQAAPPTGPPLPTSSGTPTESASGGLSMDGGLAGKLAALRSIISAGESGGGSEGAGLTAVSRPPPPLTGGRGHGAGMGIGGGGLPQRPQRARDRDIERMAEEERERGERQRSMGGTTAAPTALSAAPASFPPVAAGARPWGASREVQPVGHSPSLYSQTTTREREPLLQHQGGGRGVDAFFSGGAQAPPAPPVDTYRAAAPNPWTTSQHPPPPPGMGLPSAGAPAAPWAAEPLVPPPGFAAPVESGGEIQVDTEMGEGGLQVDIDEGEIDFDELRRMLQP
uniref:PWWP domain-containing protein n=1 Tax=Chromera velia CCMP2878 TaxID=1169474 RepID=A0A0K6SAP8_9ALVE|eukprot:Cvel_11576.t1-p1 / transcript=Cvel_11576.t1 / gene=Cvel_11576 / organism=Chromera_velia_CCMP2878 / gene_product=hypothetical protein / transcript_product=hypothetical protein / location=Cvel_scaffold732:9050-16054(+) / protein_length=1044 / sequence_SO=supercontig / SO=protein_coding / is_pseudo=false